MYEIVQYFGWCVGQSSIIEQLYCIDLHAALNSNILGLNKTQCIAVVFDVRLNSSSYNFKVRRKWRKIRYHICAVHFSRSVHSPNSVYWKEILFYSFTELSTTDCTFVSIAIDIIVFNYKYWENNLEYSKKKKNELFFL